MNSKKIVLKPGEICIIDCPFAKDDSSNDGICPGKNPKRDYNYSYNYFDVAAGYKRGAERETKKFAEAVVKRQERRQ